MQGHGSPCPSFDKTVTSALQGCGLGLRPEHYPLAMHGVAMNIWRVDGQPGRVKVG